MENINLIADALTHYYKRDILAIEEILNYYVHFKINLPHENDFFYKPFNVAEVYAIDNFIGYTQISMRLKPKQLEEIIERYEEESNLSE